VRKTAVSKRNPFAAVTVPRFALAILLVAAVSTGVIAQAPSATPTPGSTDKRGIGVQTSGPTKTSQSDQAAREAKPELVLQTGYNNFFGATRFVFSPDGRLLATTSFRGSTVKLWETASGRELRNLSTGTHSGGMSPFIAFSRDSRLIAAAAGDNSVKIWDVVSGRELQTLAGTQGSMTSAIAGVSFIGFTPDGRVVTVSDAIRVWDSASGQELRSISTATSLGTSAFMGGGGAAITPDGTQLAFVVLDDGGEIKFWDLATGRETRAINLPDKEIDSIELAFTPDGRLLACGIVDKRLRLWDVGEKGNEREVTTTAPEHVLVKFSRDGRMLAFAEGHTVKLWEVATLRELPALKAPHTSLQASQVGLFVNFSEDGKKLATGGFGTPTILWETETLKQLVKMSGRTNMAYEVAFSADGTRLSSGGRTRWDLRTGRGSRLTSAPSDGLFGMPSPDGKLLATFTMNSNVLTILEVLSGRQLQRMSPASGGGVIDRVNFSPDGTMLLTMYGPDQQQQQQASSISPGSNENQLKIWDVKSGRELRSIALGLGGASKAGFSSDGRTMATLGTMGQISLWDAGSGSKIRDLTSSPLGNLGTLGNPGSMPTSINPGAILNPGAMKSGSVAMPNMADISAMMTNMMGAMSAGTMGQTVTSLAFSPDGRSLATGGVETKSNFDMAAMMSGAPNQGKRSKKQPTPDPQDFMKSMKVETTGQVRLWDVASGSQVGELKGHGKGVTEVAFSRDGRLLASGSTDNTIRIWDLATKRELRTLTGHTSNIESIDFSPGSRLLASAGEDGGTFLWDTSTGEHLATLISLDDGGEWMVVTPQGLFDGTPVSWNQILWRYNQDTFNVAPIEWFFNEFYYPGLLSEILTGKRPRVAQDVSRKDRRQPVVKLSLAGEPAPSTGIASRRVKVRIDVTDAPSDQDHHGTGAHDLRLFRNGSLVKVWHGDVLKGQSAVTLEEEITVAAGANALTAYGFNKDNVKSKDAQLPLVGADSLKRAGTAYVIAVGLNEYANPQYNLKYAVADAQSFGDEVRTRQTQVGRFERVEVVPLLNENATKANILLALKRLAGAADPPSLKAGFLDRVKRAEPEDTVIIYFAGHGTAQAQRFYLIPHDLGYTGDRTKLTEQGLESILSHSISDIELEEAVEGLDAGHLLMIIDACNSGQALEAEEKRRGPMNSKGLAQLAYEKGMYILTAAQSYQAALEAAQLGHGLLTYALVEEGLKTPIADIEPKDGLLSAREWLDFATERVPQMQEEKMKETRGVGLAIAFTEGEQNIADPQKRTLQRPRVFYRRDVEASPLVIAKP